MKTGKLKNERFSGYFFVFPSIIFMFAFIGYPIINNIVMSFQHIDVMTINSKTKDFVGLTNYIELFNNPVLLTALVNTLVYTVVCIVFQFSLGFCLALLLNTKFAFSGQIKGILMIAWMAPITITALMFRFMFSVNGGIINEFLLFLNVIDKPIEWLLQPVTAMISVIIANIWIGIPFNMILLSAGMTTIPAELYEAATIDGANSYYKIFHITLPMLKPTIEATLILGFIYTFKVFDLVYVMTMGGPVNATEMLSTYSYKLSFTEFNFSKGAAVANILFIILFIVSLGYLRLIKDTGKN
jgi:multiple sugar transport system permease protein